MYPNWTGIPKENRPPTLAYVVALMVNHNNIFNLDGISSILNMTKNIAYTLGLPWLNISLLGIHGIHWIGIPWLGLSWLVISLTSSTLTRYSLIKSSLAQSSLTWYFMTQSFITQPCRFLLWLALIIYIKELINGIVTCFFGQHYNKKNK